MTDTLKAYLPTYACCAYLDDFLKAIQPDEPILMAQSIVSDPGQVEVKTFTVTLAQPHNGTVYYHCQVVAVYRFLHGNPFSPRDRAAVYDEAKTLADQVDTLMTERIENYCRYAAQSGRAAIIRGLVTVPDAIKLKLGASEYTQPASPTFAAWELKPESVRLAAEAPEFPDGEFPNGARFRGEEATPERPADDEDPADVSAGLS